MSVPPPRDDGPEQGAAAPGCPGGTRGAPPGPPAPAAFSWRSTFADLAERWWTDDGGAAGAASGQRPRRRAPTLTTQFSAVGAAVLLMGMLVQGAWLSDTIEDKAKFHAGGAAALFVDHVVAPYVATLAPGEPLSAEQTRAIDELMLRASSRMQVAAIKLWAPDGTVLYSTNHALVGRTFGLTEALRQAFGGEVSVEFDILDEEESAWERAIGLPLMEVYVPIRNADGRIVAVAEFYENAESLTRDLVQSQRHTWFVTGAVFLSMGAALLLIVNRGSRLIERQRGALTAKIGELSQVLQQVSDLQERVERASRLAAVEAEHALDRLGAELHDGPAQLISFAMMRLDALEAAGGATVLPETVAAHFAAIRNALADAMGDVRHICAGLSMPRIASLPIADAIRIVSEEHARRTETAVQVRLGPLPLETPHFVKASLCRFVQEGLNNAFRHAAGQGQSVHAWSDGELVCVEISDGGPGITAQAASGAQGGLGLAGLRKRIESLGGTMEISREPGGGTRLTATMSFAAGEGALHHDPRGRG